MRLHIDSNITCVSVSRVSRVCACRANANVFIHLIFIIIISSLTELHKISGLAAMLRFPVEDPGIGEDDDDDDDDDASKLDGDEQANS